MLSKPLILGVEDESGIADTIHYVLASEGFTPLWCSTAQQALPGGAQLEDADNELSGMARLVIERAKAQWDELDAHLKESEAAARAEQLIGIGAQFGAWLGLTPRQNSSGGIEREMKFVMLLFLARREFLKMQSTSQTGSGKAQAFPMWRPMRGDHGQRMEPC